MLKSNNKLFAALSAVTALAALLIYLLLPTSELANSIEHSAKDALWVLVLAPVLSLISTASFVSVLIKDYAGFSKISAEPIVTSATVMALAFGFLNFATYLSYVIDQFALGFVAPYEGTKYELLAISATIVVILNFIFSAFIIIATKRYSNK